MNQDEELSREGELRAATERLVAMQAKLDADDNAYWRMEHGAANNLVDDGIELALAYLAEHPEDDAEPVTIDWLKSVGWAVYVHFPSIRIAGGYLLEWRMAGMWIGETPIALTPTRGHVRRLCAAMGIPLKE